MKDSDLDMLWQYVTKQLEPAGVEYVEKLLKDNPKAKQRLESLETLISPSPEDAEVAEAMGQLYKRQMENLHSRSAESPERRGIIVRDSRINQGNPNVRHSGLETYRQRYRFSEDFVDLTVTTLSNDTYEIIGLITGRSELSQPSVSMVAKNSRYLVRVDTDCLFRFPCVRSDTYEMDIRDGDVCLCAIELEL